MKAQLTLGLLAAAALTVPAVPAAAVTQETVHRDCFQISQWRGWSAPDKDTLLLRMTNKDVYRADLSVGSTSLLFSGNHLVSETRGPSTVCSAVDLDLRISSGHFSEPLIVRTLTKLSAEEVAALPAKDRP